MDCQSTASVPDAMVKWRLNRIWFFNTVLSSNAWSVFLSETPSASAAAMAVAWWPLQTMVGYIFQPGFRWSGKVTAALQHRRMRFSLIIAHFSSTSFETGKCGPPDIRCLDHQYPWITKFMLQAEFWAIESWQVFSHTDSHFKVVHLTIRKLQQRPQLYLTPSWARELVFSSQETD